MKIMDQERSQTHGDCIENNGSRTLPNASHGSRTPKHMETI